MKYLLTVTKFRESMSKACDYTAFNKLCGFLLCSIKSILVGHPPEVNSHAKRLLTLDILMVSHMLSICEKTYKHL